MAKLTDTTVYGDLTVDGVVNGDLSGNATTATTAANCSRSVIAGTGCTGGGTLNANRTINVTYGTSSGTACEGDDSRLSDARTPTSHSASSHSDINQDLLTTSNPTFNRVYLSDYGYALGGFHVGGTSDPGTDNLIVDGNVGIGTTSLDNALTVNGDVDITGALSMEGGRCKTRLVSAHVPSWTNTPGAATMEVTNYQPIPGTDRAVSGLHSYREEGTSGSGNHIAIASHDGSSIVIRKNSGVNETVSLGGLFASPSSTDIWRVNASGNMTVTGNSYLLGNVGIGTYSPGAKLDVVGPSHTQGSAALINGNSTTLKIADYTLNSPTVSIYAGIHCETKNTGSTYRRHVAGWFKAGSHSTENSYGVFAEADSGSTCYGVYGKASGGTTNWAGWFEGNVHIIGSLSKGSGSFKIDHPLENLKDTHHLVHSFLESPGADLVYSGMVKLTNGKATVNIDEAANMTEGTFVELCRATRRFTSNESGYVQIRSKLQGNLLTIEAEIGDCQDEIFWVVIGERQDKHMYDTDWTDENGKVITEPEKSEDETNHN